MTGEALAPPREVWFEEFDHKRPYTSLFATAGRVLLQPTRFFEALDPEGSYLTAMGFAIGNYCFYAILAGFSYTLAISLVEQHPFMLGAALGAAVGNLAAVPAVLLISPLFAAVTHLCVKLFASERSTGYRATFRVLAYSSAPDVIAWIPVVGLVVDLFWAIILATIGIRVLHRTSNGRALLCVVLSIFLGLVMFFALLGLVAFVLAGAALLLGPR